VTDLSLSFGDSRVSPEERERRIRALFGRIARRYDLMNDLMSFGIHRIWKRDLAWAADPAAEECALDIAGGTGDVARRLAGADRRVLVCDPSEAMMQVGRVRGVAGVAWLAAPAESLPLADASVDLVTMAFGIRNVTHMEDALAEIFRVLKPGGRFLCLEFSRPVAIIRPLYQAFSWVVIPRLGRWVANDPDAYHYLIESIKRFPEQKMLKRRFEEAGFEDVHYKNLSFGIACIHLGFRPLDQ
jgi:demethylmenaquinone methyltransferase/2-methoxy-6-polyprenyl-1,4-benzoquinol methylase